MNIKVEKTECTCKTVHCTGIILGVLLILLGGLLLSAKLGVMPCNLGRVIVSWQMLLIVIGILSLFKRHPFTGLFFILIGSFFIVPRLAEVFPNTFYWVNDNYISDYCWSGLLLGAGVLIVIYWVVSPRKKWHGMGKHRHGKWEKQQCEINGDFSKTHVFSGGKYIVLEPEFKGGEVKTVFGGTEIDLRKTSLPEGDTYLEIQAVFSGIELLVPCEWKVETQIECTFSGISDKRCIVEPIDTSRRLILTGSCVFSGCEIKY
jgi:predicted membrane protein